MTRCDCCDLPVESCGKAAEQRQRAEAAQDRPPHGKTVEARYTSRCAYCGEPMRMGSLITYDQEHGWCCDPCTQELAS